MDYSKAGTGIYIVIYIVTAISLFFMAKKANVKNPWLSFIPVLQLIVMLHIIDKSGWNIFLMLIPVLNIVLAIIWTVKLYLSFDVNVGLIIASIVIPIVGWFTMLLVAFSEKYSYVKNTRFTA